MIKKARHRACLFLQKTIDNYIGGRYNYIVNRYIGKRYTERGNKNGIHSTYRSGILYPSLS